MGDRPTPDATTPPPDEPPAHPVRARVVEYLLSVDEGAVGMPRVVNETARFIAGGEATSVEEFALETVRRELEAEHVPALIRTGLVTYDGESDVLALAVPASEARRALERRIASDESGE